METPLVTVYIPTHNRAKLVERAVMSIINQTYKNIEIIVVNDGSSDETLNVLKRLKNQFGIRYFHLDKPMGACYARNIAIKNANGTYITGLDDDDIFLEKRIDNLVSVYSSEYSFLCTCMLTEIGKKKYRTTYGYKQGLIGIDQIYYMNFVGNQIFTELYKMKQIGGFDESLPSFQDYDMWVRMIKRFGPAKKIETYDYLMYLDHGDRISSSYKKRLSGLELFCEKHAKSMNHKHRKSMSLLKKSILGEPLSFFEMLSHIGNYSYKSALNYYVEKNLLPIKKLYTNLKKL